MYKIRHGGSSSFMRFGVLALAVAWGSLAAAAEDMTDHSHHDHMAHQADAPVDGDDPHAHHRAMMAQTGYKRSEHRYSLDEIPVVTMEGDKTTILAALNGDKPVMVNFIFTTCTTICPVLSATFQQVQSELGAEAESVTMVSISIDPEYDTPERLRDYAKLFNAGKQWEFLTGNLDDMIAVQSAFDVYRGGKMNHEPTVLLRQGADDPWVRLDGLVSAKDVVKEYRQLIGS